MLLNDLHRSEVPLGPHVQDQLSVLDLVGLDLGVGLGYLSATVGFSQFTRDICDFNSSRVVSPNSL